MEDTDIRVLTKEVTLEGISQPLMLCKREDGQPLDLTQKRVGRGIAMERSVYGSKHLASRAMQGEMVTSS